MEQQRSNNNRVDRNRRNMMIPIVLGCNLMMLIMTTSVPSYSCYAFQSPSWTPSLSRSNNRDTKYQRQPSLSASSCEQHQQQGATPCSTTPITTRRRWLQDITIATTTTTTTASIAATVAGATTPILMMNPQLAVAADDAVTTIATATDTISSNMPSLEMKSFLDPQGLFALNVPKDFFTLRRTQKGDLPDAKTGKGRRGSSIFTAGNMAKAEVVAVERFPTRVLLEENGITVNNENQDDLSTFPKLGDAKAVANLIVLRREKDTQNVVGTKVLDNVQVSPDGKTLTFRLKTEIDVQKPDLLLEQYGVSRLFRITLAKATLDSNDGNIMAVFASALEQDFTNGVDGPALEQTVQSFQAFSNKNPPQ